MAQRESGYERRPRDLYETPAWVTEVLVDVLERDGHLAPGAVVWEPAAGTGKMVRALKGCGFDVVASDIEPDDAGGMALDFVREHPLPFHFDAIITNPPYLLADLFIDVALDRAERGGGVVAMLLKVDFDSGRTRAPLFRDHPAFCTKIVLLDRIHWFDPEPRRPGEKPPSGPSENHAWFVWDWRRRLPSSQPASGAGRCSGAAIRYAEAPEDVRADLREKRRAVSHEPA